MPFIVASLAARAFCAWVATVPVSVATPEFTDTSMSNFLRDGSAFRRCSMLSSRASSADLVVVFCGAIAPARTGPATKSATTPIPQIPTFFIALPPEHTLMNNRVRKRRCSTTVNKPEQRRDQLDVGDVITDESSVVEFRLCSSTCEEGRRQQN